MNIRQPLFRAMLWSLALSAGCGVLAVLFQGGDVVWRIVGTGVTTAAACALMLPTSLLVDREKSRPAGLLGMSVITLEFAFAQVLIWDIPRLLGWAGRDESIALTMTFVALATLAIMLCLGFSVHPFGRIAAPVGVAVTVVWFAVFMVPTWAGRAVAHHDKWWQSGGAVAAIGAIAFLALTGAGTEPERRWRVGGAAAAIVAGLLWQWDIWVGTGSHLGFIMFVISLSASLVVGHANLAMFCPLKAHERWVRVAAVIAVTCTAALMDVIIIDARLGGLEIDEDVFARLASATGILAGCGSLALCVLARMNRKIDFDTPVGEFARVIVVCPRCRKKQPIDIGDSSCAACGLRITIRVEEPRCPHCDYLLIGLTSERCPECGATLQRTSPSA
ncbi:MAG: hypothetical protein ACE5E6_09545 [Phycisphaerae bacterium]